MTHGARPPTLRPLAQRRHQRGLGDDAGDLTAGEVPTELVRRELRVQRHRHRAQHLDGEERRHEAACRCPARSRRRRPVRYPGAAARRPSAFASPASSAQVRRSVPSTSANRSPNRSTVRREHAGDRRAALAGHGARPATYLLMAASVPKFSSVMSVSRMSMPKASSMPDDHAEERRRIHAQVAQRRRVVERPRPGRGAAAGRRAPAVGRRCQPAHRARPPSAMPIDPDAIPRAVALTWRRCSTRRGRGFRSTSVIVSPSGACRLRTPTSRWRPLPDLLVIGAQRCGTSTLYRYLGRHPDVSPSLRKETEYFSRRYGRGERWYRAHFALQPGRTPTVLRGDTGLPVPSPRRGAGGRRRARGATRRHAA